MKQVITALGNPIVNEKLRKYPQIQIPIQDIQYQEGIIEILENNKKIQVIILSELLPGKQTIKQLVETIKKINSNIHFIIILEKQNEELENILLSKGKVTICYNNQIKIEEMVHLIVEKQEHEKLEYEIRELKQLLKQRNKTQLEKEQIVDKEVLKIDEIKSIEEEIEKEYQEKKSKISFIKNIKGIHQKENKNAKIVTVSGLSGIGKSIFTFNLSNILQQNKKKILMMDFDVLNNTISSLVKKKKQPVNKALMVSEEMTPYNQQEGLEKIYTINPRLDLIKGVDLLYQQENRVDEEKFIKLLNTLKPNYDLIIIDTSTECLYDFTKHIMKQSDKIIFISEANLAQIKKSKIVLEMYLKQWDIKQNKFNLIFNKNREDSIDFNILKEVFKEYSIIGKIDFIKQYNTLINQNMNTLFIEKNIKKEYLKIGREILKHEKTNIYYLNKIKEEGDQDGTITR